MNGRTLSLVVLAAVLGFSNAVVAEGESETPAPVLSASASTASAPQHTVQAFSPSLDLRDLRMTDGLGGGPGTFKAFGVGMFVAAGADLASTELGLRKAGVYEMNPIQGNRSVRVLTHVAAPVFMYWVSEKIHENGKPKLALAARIGFSVAYSYVVMHNLRTAGSMP